MKSLTIATGCSSLIGIVIPSALILSHHCFVNTKFSLSYGVFKVNCTACVNTTGTGTTINGVKPVCTHKCYFRSFGKRKRIVVVLQKYTTFCNNFSCCFLTPFSFCSNILEFGFIVLCIYVRINLFIYNLKRLDMKSIVDNGRVIEHYYST